MNRAEHERDDVLKEQYGSKTKLCKNQNRRKNNLCWCCFWGSGNDEEDVASTEDLHTNGLYRRRKFLDGDVPKGSKRMKPPVMRASAKVNIVN
ncbi:unnamed protein product [Acanthoscelides obtectus]|uniref:Uncharacterized protein n=1 Tax=Acanthoscelides obtectus TaxID=200917 RepID=A0A9P0P260_ACAOB|nr:unnamed protein product [Acanthoscelides obtectus]CAK1658495.1 hypothetical protein AOBTE_LOCUS20937 [Acanthoscelides obtectus]